MNAVTLIGKLLVFTVVVLSLLFAGMALGLYTNRINWLGGGSGEAAQGELAKRQEEVKQLKEAVEQGRNRWLLSRAALAKAEVDRQQDQDWYADQLAARKTGRDRKDNPVADPVQVIVYDKAGKMQFDRQGRPALEKLDLPPLEELGQQSKQVDKEIADEIDGTKKALEEEKRLTGQIKGLRVLIDEEDRAKQNSVAELQYLEPFLYNREVESQLLVRRQHALQSRVEELQKSVGVSARRP